MQQFLTYPNHTQHRDQIADGQHAGLKSAEAAPLLNIDAGDDQRAGDGVQQEIRERRAAVGAVFKQREIDKAGAFFTTRAGEKQQRRQHKNRAGDQHHAAQPAERAAFGDSPVQADQHHHKGEQTEVVEPVSLRCGDFAFRRAADQQHAGQRAENR